MLITDVIISNPVFISSIRDIAFILAHPTEQREVPLSFTTTTHDLVLVGTFTIGRGDLVNGKIPICALKIEIED